MFPFYFVVKLPHWKLHRNSIGIMKIWHFLTWRVFDSIWETFIRFQPLYRPILGNNHVWKQDWNVLGWVFSAFLEFCLISSLIHLFADDIIKSSKKTNRDNRSKNGPQKKNLKPNRAGGVQKGQGQKKFVKKNEPKVTPATKKLVQKLVSVSFNLCYIK